MEVNIQVQCRTKALNEGDSSSARRLVRVASAVNQVRGNGAIDDAERLALGRQIPRAL